MAGRQLDVAWNRLGFEVELLAPPGASRATLAAALADCGTGRGSGATDGSVRTIFHHDTEPSLVKGRPVFHHLSRGFDVVADGRLACRLVDDVTIQDDLDRHVSPADGWYRILSDDSRLLRLVEQLADPAADLSDVLKPVAEAFGASAETLAGKRVRVDDVAGATIAIAAPQGGERERVCEIITPPLVSDVEATLAALLEPAAALGFTVPVEAAVHVHLDAAPFRSAAALRRLVRVFSQDRDELWRTLGTNPACRRLGPLPTELVDGVEQNGFQHWSWDRIAEWLRSLPLTKFSDCNLTNLAAPAARIDTVELRLLPGSIDAASITSGVAELRRRLGGPL